MDTSKSGFWLNALIMSDKVDAADVNVELSSVLMHDRAKDSVANPFELYLGLFKLKFHCPDTLTGPFRLAAPFTVSMFATVAELMALVATLATLAVAFAMVVPETTAIGRVVVPVNAGFAFGTFSAFRVASVALRTTVSLLVTRVKSTTPDNTSDVVSFSTTSSSISVLAKD